MTLTIWGQASWACASFANRAQKVAGSCELSKCWCCFFILREFWAYWLRILQSSSQQSVRKPRYRADGYESSSTMDATEILKLLGIIICFIAVIVGTAKVLKLYSSFGDPVLKKLTRLVIVISAIPCVLRLIALAISLIAGKYITLWFLTPKWFWGY